VQLLTPWPGLCGVGWVRWLGEEPSRKEGEGGGVRGASGFVRGFVPSFAAAAVRACGGGDPVTIRRSMRCPSLPRLSLG
jgi:hypothetical protein